MKRGGASSPEQLHDTGGGELIALAIESDNKTLGIVKIGKLRKTAAQQRGAAIRIRKE